MNNIKSLSVLAIALVSAFAGSSAMASESTSNLTVSATLQTACQVSASSAISFGSFAALAASGDRTANSGSTFQVACSAGATPTIYADAARSMSNGTDSLPFNLSLTAGAESNDLPSTDITGAPVLITKDGSLHDLVLYAMLPVANYKAKSSGAYSTIVTVAVVY